MRASWMIEKNTVGGHKHDMQDAIMLQSLLEKVYILLSGSAQKMAPTQLDMVYDKIFESNFNHSPSARSNVYIPQLRMALLL